MLFIVIVILVILGVLLVRSIKHRSKRNEAIMQNGIETDAVVSRVVESVSTDDDDEDGGGSETYSYSYYVTFQTQEGQTVEARLGSGKTLDVRVGGAGWDRDLHEGSHVRIMYLPERPDYAILIAR